jgi:hypothetical protein
MKGPCKLTTNASVSVVKLEVPMAAAPWIVSDELVADRAAATQGRAAVPLSRKETLPDRQALQGILFVLSHKLPRGGARR